MIDAMAGTRSISRVAGVIALVFVACTGDDDDDSSSPTAPDSVDKDGGGSSRTESSTELSTIPTRTGTVVLELDGESFDLEIDICDLDEDGLEFLAYDEEREPPVRVEYSTNTGGRLVVAIDAADVLDPGVESWTGEPELGLTSESAVASDIEMTDLDGSSVEASLEVSCPELE